MDDCLRVFIIERDLFVSQDIADSFRSVKPSAACSTYQSVDEARAAAQEGADPQLVLMSAGADGTLRITPDDMAWLRARKIITFDVRNPQPDASWANLSKPFTEEELIETAFRMFGCGTGPSLPEPSGV
ncbi:response regulator [Roseobacter weihaiensis]|uniref:hypothetical protein n=1 Tax=Roseobacter weihaiensis TaxID=2763262 RepID=UPI001D09BCDB|nr:hypothetical protein [Roseobacter sp. H9]